MKKLEHNRITPEGQRCGEQLSRMTDIEVGKLIAEGEWKVVGYFEITAHCA